MELVGEEKKIRALFSEVKFADEQTVPDFAKVWNRAQSKAFRPRKGFNLSFVVATALLVCALVGLALWLRHWQQSRQPSVAIVKPLTPSITPRPAAPKSPELNTKATFHPTQKSRLIKLASRREAERVALEKAEIRNAVAISSWQSPTSPLMRSPSEQVLTTLPHLNDAATQLRLFLPDRDK